MKDERCRELMADMGMPDSKSLYIALNQVENETAQEMKALNDELVEALEIMLKPYSIEHPLLSKSELDFAVSALAKAKL